MKIKTRRRICLTGTPFQNNLLEYYHMVSFVHPNLLDSERMFQKKFVDPIQSSMGSDAPEDAKVLADERLADLVKILDPYIHRRDSSLLRNDLPHLQQVCLYVPPTKMQRALYKAFRDHQDATNERNFLKQYASLRTVHNHPGTLLLLDAEEKGGCKKVPILVKPIIEEKTSTLPVIKREPMETEPLQICNQTNQDIPDASEIIEISSSDEEEDQQDETYPTNNRWWAKVARKFGNLNMKRIERYAKNLQNRSTLNDTFKPTSQT